jgi:hypothetical protein
VNPETRKYGPKQCQLVCPTKIREGFLSGLHLARL